jgi:hypothetical protein
MKNTNDTVLKTRVLMNTQRTRQAGSRADTLANRELPRLHIGP